MFAHMYLYSLVSCGPISVFNKADDGGNLQLSALPRCPSIYEREGNKNQTNSFPVPGLLFLIHSHIVIDDHFNYALNQNRTSHFLFH